MFKFLECINGFTKAIVFQIILVIIYSACLYVYSKIMGTGAQIKKPEVSGWFSSTVKITEDIVGIPGKETFVKIFIFAILTVILQTTVAYYFLRKRDSSQSKLKTLMKSLIPTALVMLIVGGMLVFSSSVIIPILGIVSIFVPVLWPVVIIQIIMMILSYLIGPHVIIALQPTMISSLIIMLLCLFPKII